MKFHYFLSAIVSVVAVFLFCSCEKSGNDIPENFTPVGTWAYVTTSEHSPNHTNVVNANAKITFDANGDFSFTIYSDPEVKGYGKWTWVINNEGIVETDNYIKMESYYATIPEYGYPYEFGDIIAFDHDGVIVEENYIKDERGTEYVRVATEPVHHDLMIHSGIYEESPGVMIKFNSMVSHRGESTFAWGGRI